jgi:manganese/zinc/iron transport system permease protein
MVLLAGGFGALAGVIGAVISSTARGLSTGPTIVLVVSAFVVISLLLAPNRGLVWKWLRQRRTRRRLHAAQQRSEIVTGVPAIDEPGR